MFPCEIQRQASQPTLSIRFRAAVGDLSAHFGRVYGDIYHYLGELGEQPVGPPFATYHNMDMDDMDVEAGFPVARLLPDKGEIVAGSIPGGNYAICHYTGPYDGLASAYDELTEYVRHNGFAPSGIAYERYLTGPEVPPQQHKTDIAFPVQRITDHQPV
jgi:effector-binding domain-containing protein